MSITHFSPGDPLIIVRGYLWGPLGRQMVRLVLDTGASETILTPDILDDLGYSPNQGEAMSSVYSVIGREEGYLIRVARFRALGHELTDFRIAAHDLPEDDEIDGLLGLSFLRNFNYEIRSQDGQIVATPTKILAKRI